MTWQDSAACIGQHTDDYFTEKKYERTPQVLIDLCRTCPSQLPCLVAGLGERWGMWGGVTQTERERLRLNVGIPGQFQDEQITHDMHALAAELNNSTEPAATLDRAFGPGATRHVIAALGMVSDDGKVAPRTDQGVAA